MTYNARLLIVLMLVSSKGFALEANPFLPNLPETKIEQNQGSRKIEDSEADRLRMLAQNGNLEFLGEVNGERVYFDRSTGGYVYIPVAILEGGEA